MAKVNVTICTGTTCYVMGSAELAAVKDRLDEDIQQHVEIKGSACLGLCKNDKYHGAPFVRINETLIEQATVDAVISEIKRQLNA